MNIPIPPGVFDILPHDSQEPWKSSYLWNYVETVIRDTAKIYGYSEIRTPIFERTELFVRGVGETSDIVTKEMYTFEDRGGRSMTLRPEGTAPALRAFIENKLYNESSTHHLYYIEPMFRYERSQAGRYRQHHQFGIEAIGNDSPEQDAEVIDLLYTLYNRLGLKNLGVYINSIGDTDSRLAFRTALMDFLRPHFNDLSADSQKRFEANPLRILDSKDPKDREIIANAPSILDFLNSECKDHFEKVKVLLDGLKIPYQINNRLVRGLDYYNKTVFEIVAGELGAQNSIGGGGRYDGLIKQLGGPDLSAFGFGTGIERVIQTMLKQEVSLPSPDRPMVFFIPLGDIAKQTCFSLVHSLRQKGIPVQMDFSGRKLGKVMQYADQLGSRYVIVMGEREIQEQIVEMKDMLTGKSQKISLHDLPAILRFELKNAEYMRVLDEITTPFERQSQADYIIQKVGDSIKETQVIANEFQMAMQKMKKLLEE